MNPTVRSALIAGVLAGVIYTVIALAAGTAAGAAIGVGLIFFVGTAVIAFGITLLITKMMAQRRS